MESGHKQLLFTSCDTSKVQTSDHSKNKWIFDALQLKWIKIIQALSMFLFHTYKIQSEWLWKYIIRPIRDIDNSTSQWKSQCAWNNHM